MLSGYGAPSELSGPGLSRSFPATLRLAEGVVPEAMQTPQERGMRP